jgi:hypothetical protein
MAPIYAQRHKKITTDENGKPGPLFYQWVASINLAPVLTAGAILVRLLLRA